MLTNHLSNYIKKITGKTLHWIETHLFRGVEWQHQLISIMLCHDPCCLLPVRAVLLVGDGWVDVFPLFAGGEFAVSGVVDSVPVFWLSFCCGLSRWTGLWFWGRLFWLPSTIVALWTHMCTKMHHTSTNHSNQEVLKNNQQQFFWQFIARYNFAQP